MIIPKPIEFLCKYKECPDNKDGVCCCPVRTKEGACLLCAGLKV